MERNERKLVVQIIVAHRIGCQPRMQQTRSEKGVLINSNIAKAVFLSHHVDLEGYQNDDQNTFPRKVTIR